MSEKFMTFVVINLILLLQYICADSLSVSKYVTIVENVQYNRLLKFNIFLSWKSNKNILLYLYFLYYV